MLKGLNSELLYLQRDHLSDELSEFSLEEDHEFCKDFIYEKKQEYLIARALCRKGFEKLGIKDTKISRGEMNEPLFPNGIVGSISHSKGFVGVLLSTNHKSVGLDIEHKNRVQEKIYHKLFHPEEIETISKIGNDYATLLFSAKEAFYKLQYPISKEYLGFLDVTSQWNDDHLVIQLVKSSARYPQKKSEIFFEEIGGKWITYCWI